MRLGLKIAMVVAMTLTILVPLMMIRGVINERQGYRDEVVRDIAGNFGGRQVVGGPVLVVPYVESEAVEVTGDDGVVRKTVRRSERQWTFFPDRLVMEGELKPETRSRGLHKVRVYQWHGTAQARFDVRIPDDGGEGRQRVIGQPWLSYGIADVRGLAGTPALQVNGTAMAVAQGIGHADGPGVHVRFPVPASGSRLLLDARLAMDLRGTESFSMMPYAKDNELRLSSRWPHPKFEGLSPQKDIGSDGFRASWRIAAVATNAQRRYLQNPSMAPEKTLPDQPRRQVESMPWSPAGDSVSVSLIDPVNPYLQAERATKYGLLFVALTFVGFFMFELVKQLPVHPIQYLLVGLAIAIFFLLLVSLSEHLAFGLSYLVAACACIGLIAFYLSSVLRSRARGLGFAAMLATLYAALYGLLLSEDNALALGAGLLFVVLAAIMVATRKVDWYQVSARVGSPSASGS
ncbi:MAG: cell envelope integrity protein CreD [Lysobacteraceae bacterium]|nr:MAG: cell envelope integrity protein CreD [Xanthomonadaceae bacterium]